MAKSKQFCKEEWGREVADVADCVELYASQIFKKLFIASVRSSRSFIGIMLVHAICLS